jgi:hypothetical protein
MKQNKIIESGMLLEKTDKKIDWIRYSHVLGKINLAYRAHLISEAEYLRTLKTLKKDYRLV